MICSQITELIFGLEVVLLWSGPQCLQTSAPRIYATITWNIKPKKEDNISERTY